MNKYILEIPFGAQTIKVSVTADTEEEAIEDACHLITENLNSHDIKIKTLDSQKIDNDFNMQSRALWQDLRQQAHLMAETADNKYWVNCWRNLENDCDNLDCMFARTSVSSND